MVLTVLDLIQVCSIHTIAAQSPIRWPHSSLYMMCTNTPLTAVTKKWTVKMNTYECAYNFPLIAIADKTGTTVTANVSLVGTDRMK